MATTTERGYGADHQREKERHRSAVDAGHAYCTETICLEERDGRGRHIRPGTDWDLAHDRARGPTAYLGPAHARCNRSEGARWRDQKNSPNADTTEVDWGESRWWTI